MTTRCVVMDIEGTILPIAFVRDVLFPYAKRRMASFLQERRADSGVRQWAALCQESIADETGIRIDYDHLADILDQWIEQDRKHRGLKALQGMIWEEGYERGAFAPALYDDVLPALIAWRAAGLQLALYSSGSEQAQRLLLGHTTKGDITGFFSHLFDTRVGAKTDPKSFRRIAAELQLAPEALHFLSDVELELDAAHSAGLRVTQIARPGTPPSTRHPVAGDFRSLTLKDPLQTSSTPGTP
ncbi:MAG TPA: acireductone synthase [Nitrospira sp.]|nr:acireductone synthase [Nitrospira sp.]